MGFKRNEKILLVLIIGLLILITILTKFYGGTDAFDYADTAKFFAKEYDAKIRTSHSYLYGLIHAPFIGLFGSFWIFKVTSLISLLLIIYSVYIISRKDKRSLWLITLSPIVWYMAPIISPIQLASLLFLWGWYFVKKYDSGKDLRKKITYLFYSGALVGLSWAFWDGVLFFIPLFIISFLYDKKFIHGIYFAVFVLIGTIPRLILDQILFGFAFFGVIRHIMASLALTFLGGFYEQGGLWGITNFILLIIFFPIFTYLILNKEIFNKNKKSAIFILLSIILLIINSQIRFVLLITPLIILSIYSKLTERKYFIQIAFSFILILLVLNPYILQIRFGLGKDVNGIEFDSFIRNIREINLNDKFERDILRSDLNRISNEYPNELFVVGNKPDDYRVLANLYWGSEIKELVSIEDYKLHFSGNPIIAKKEICSHARINDRRDICTSIWIRKAFGDETEYDTIKYAISFEEELNLDEFVLIKRYDKLNLFGKD